MLRGARGGRTVTAAVNGKDGPSDPSALCEVASSTFSVPSAVAEAEAEAGGIGGSGRCGGCCCGVAAGVTVVTG